MTRKQNYPKRERRKMQTRRNLNFTTTEHSDGFGEFELVNDIMTGLVGHEDTGELRQHYTGHRN